MPISDYVNKNILKRKTFWPQWFFWSNQIAAFYLQIRFLESEVSVLFVVIMNRFLNVMMIKQYVHINWKYTTTRYQIINKGIWELTVSKYKRNNNKFITRFITIHQFIVNLTNFVQQSASFNSNSGQWRK